MSAEHTNTLASTINSKAVVITGCSSGIGLATTAYLIERGVHVFATVRKAQDASQLQQRFADSVTPLLLDVTDEAAITKAVATVEDTLQSGTLWGLVNNAGIAVEGPLLHLTSDDLRHQLEVNLVAVHNMVKAFAPLLGSDRARTGKPGRIINISSVGGKQGAPFVGPYVASKHALEGYSESLRRELMQYGIDVIIVGPGSVKTPIWDKSAAVNLEKFASTDYGASLQRFKAYMLQEGKNGLAPEVIADVIWQALLSAKPNVRYAPVPNKFVNWTLPMLLPKRWLDRLIARNINPT
ncbi:MAG: SDR family oxidoreductase [Deinococcota bacterium]